MQTQALLGAKNAAAFDLTAACSGFVMGLVTAAQYIRAGTYRNIVVVGADALSRYIDWRDRGTCILFGDGCGAVVLTAQEGPCSLMGMQMNSGEEGSAAAAVLLLTVLFLPGLVLSRTGGVGQAAPGMMEGEQSV